MREAVARAYASASARPTDAEATGALGRLLHAWEQWDAAHDAYSRAAALAPRALDWPYLDACVLQRLARHQEASTRLRAALAITPDYLPARVKLAESLYETGSFEESRRLFDALIRERAAEPAAVFGLGRIAAAEGRHEEAVTLLNRAVALFPEWGAAHYALAQSLRALGRRDEAQRALDLHAKYGAAWPAVEDRLLAAVNASRDDAGARLRRGLKLSESGDVAGAITEHEAALALDPSLAVAHENLITLYGRTGDWSKAEAHYHAAVALGFNLADVHYDYGVLLGLQEKWDLAADAYRRALAVNPSHAQAYNNLGQILERSRQFDAALDAYRHAVESQPTFRLARFNAGRALVALGRPREAIAEFEKVARPRDAESPRYVFGLAVAYLRAGDKAEGLRLAAEAKQLAERFGQHDLAAAIERELASIK
jgi:tetratricopeptide (TPR) repeat protein